MNIDSNDIDKVLDNDSTPHKARSVVKWFASAEGIFNLTAKLQRDINSVEEKKAEQWVDHPIPSARMKNRLMSSVKRQGRMRLVKIAAVVLPFLLLSGTLAFVLHRTAVLAPMEYAEYVVPVGERMLVVLQDGTTVHLNSESRLRYPKKFGLFERNVELNGEGYFSVAQESSRPFIVKMSDMDIKVTGTQFNAQAYLDDNFIRVLLDEGGVKLKDVHGKEYRMMSGNVAEYNKKTGLCIITKPSDTAPLKAWKSNNLNFYRTPLSDVLKTLERQYGVKFQYKDKTLLETRFTLSTNKVYIEDILLNMEKVSLVEFKLITPGVYQVSTK